MGRRWDRLGSAKRFRNARAAAILVAAILASAAIIGFTGPARGSGAAYAVDSAEVDEPGGCQIETWSAFASNRDFVAVVNPACVFNIARPVEVSVQVSRSRADRE